TTTAATTAATAARGIAGAFAMMVPKPAILYCWTPTREGHVRGRGPSHWQLDPNFRTHTGGSWHGRFVPGAVVEAARLFECRPRLPRLMCILPEWPEIANILSNSWSIWPTLEAGWGIPGFIPD
ncbi:MAG: hypothetical protein WB820_17680, partial [Rhodoplanes sp.]